MRKAIFAVMKKHILYICLFIFFVSARIFVEYLVKCVEAVEIINELASGAAASVVVAWLINIADNIKRDRENESKRQMIFAEYYAQILRLRKFVANASATLNINKKKRKFEEYLFLLSNLSNYNRIDSTSAENYRNRNYQSLIEIIKNIQISISMLLIQHSLLIQGEFIKENGLDHLNEQQLRCENIVERFDISDFESVNDGVRILYSRAVKFFSKKWEFPEEYDYGMDKPDNRGLSAIIYEPEFFTVSDYFHTNQCCRYRKIILIAIATLMMMGNAIICFLTRGHI